MKIKICGLQTREDILYVNEANPNFIGFIFAKESKRQISIQKAKELKNLLNSTIKSVGVFVNSDIKTILEIKEQGIIDIIQLHGEEDNKYIKLLKDKTQLPIIKALKASEHLEKEIETTLSDYVLIDNKTGGSGKTFDWNLIPKTRKKIFLAGGLNTNNIIEAIKIVNPYCLDINSGVETNNKKDRDKIIKITELIKGYKNE